MELNLTEQKVSTGTGMAFRQFGVDTVIAMIALREKIYADPVKACVQEYMSNARDANREAGRATVPIQVRGPSADTPCFVFKDNGIGINPDRMENVFTCYGKSTKRDTNKQTGGWGLGCKAGFAVADQFTVVTTWEREDGKRFRSTYLMLIDETQASTFAKLSEDAVADDTPTGTEIHLPIDPDEQKEFREAVITTGRWWGHPFYAEISALPEVDWSTDARWGDYSASQLVEGDNWCSYGNHYHDGGVILDGIQYDLRSQNLKRAGLTDTDLNALSAILCFYNTGEIMVTATREDIDYSSSVTIDTIRGQADKLMSRMQEDLDALIASQSDYLAVSRQAMELRKKWGELFIPLFKQARVQVGDEQMLLFDFDAKVQAPTGTVGYRVRKARNRQGFEIDKVSYGGMNVDDNVFVLQDVTQLRNMHIRGVLETLEAGFTETQRRQCKPVAFYLIGPAEKDMTLDPKTVWKAMGLEYFNFAKLSTYPKAGLPKGDTRIRPLPKMFARVFTNGDGWERTERLVSSDRGGVYVFFYKNKPHHDRECEKEVDENFFKDAAKLCRRVYGISPDVADSVHSSWLHIDQWATKFMQRTERFKDRWVAGSIEFLSEIHKCGITFTRKVYNPEKGQHDWVTALPKRANPAVYLPDPELRKLADLLIREGQWHSSYSKMGADAGWKSFRQRQRKLARTTRLEHSELARYTRICEALAMEMLPSSTSPRFAHWRDASQAVSKRFPLLTKLEYDDAILPDVRAYLIGKLQAEKSISATKPKTKNKRIRP